MELLNASMVTDLVKMTAAVLKSHDVLHPLVVHFPVALLPVAPILIVLGVLFKKTGRAYLLSALFLIVIGTAATYAAVSSGSEAEKLVNRTDAISAVLEKHEDFAKETRSIFTALAVIFAAMTLVPIAIRKDPAPVIFYTAHALYLAVYLVGILLVLSTAHQGGLLVHKFGVHAMLPPTL